MREGVYFVTARCADSLPRETVNRLRTIRESLAAIEPNSARFAELQRRYFAAMDKHLDAGLGACRLADSRAAAALAGELSNLAEWRVNVPHYSIMPNHWHAIVEHAPACGYTLGEIMRRVKGRTARTINALFGDAGVFWQREWFDRWMRSRAELEKCIRYIQNNPAKAGLVRTVGEHPWTI